MKKKKNEQKIGECIYCGIKGSISRDHVPPKCLFLEPLPSELITVPSCNSCNKSFSKDDEYFRNAIIVREDTAGHITAIELNKKVAESINRVKSLGFKKYLYNQYKIVDLFTPSDLYLGKKQLLFPDLKRIENTGKRIIKGLFFYKNKIVLPIEYSIAIRNLEFFNKPIEMVDLLLSQEPTIIGDNVFSFRHLVSEEDMFSTSWLLTFYGGSPFLAITYNLNNLPVIK